MSLYTPELNPAEKAWQYFKNQIAIKFFDDIKTEEILQYVKS